MTAVFIALMVLYLVRQYRKVKVVETLVVRRLINVKVRRVKKYPTQLYVRDFVLMRSSVSNTNPYLL